MKTITYKGWEFTQKEPEPIFGKLKITATSEIHQEDFYVYAESLTLDLCQDLYNQYLYIYG